VSVYQDSSGVRDRHNSRLDKILAANRNCQMFVAFYGGDFVLLPDSRSEMTKFLIAYVGIVRDFVHAYGTFRRAPQSALGLRRQACYAILHNQPNSMRAPTSAKADLLM